MLRGAGVAAGAFVIFAVLYAFGLPLVERGWHISQAPGILVAALMLGLLMVGPVILIGGMIAGLALYVLGRRAFGERDGQAPEHPTA
jgi:predicted branched-subunit amino acid permease